MFLLPNCFMNTGSHSESNVRVISGDSLSTYGILPNVWLVLIAAISPWWCFIIRSSASEGKNILFNIATLHHKQSAGLQLTLGCDLRRPMRADCLEISRSFLHLICVMACYIIMTGITSHNHCFLSWGHLVLFGPKLVLARPSHSRLHFPRSRLVNMFNKPQNVMKAISQILKWEQGALRISSSSDQTSSSYLFALPNCRWAAVDHS